MVENKNEALRYVQENKRIANMEMDLPDYLNHLKKAILAAPVKKPVFLSNIKASLIDDPILSAKLMQLSNELKGRDGEDLKSLIKSNESLEIYFEKNEVTLGAILLPKLMIENRMSTPAMVHQGYFYMPKEEETEFLRRVENSGVFGDDRMGYPTYLKLVEEEIHPNSYKPKKKPVCLYVDGNILAKYRSIYTDPEGVSLTPLAQELGKSFFILGGIPTTAIIGLSTHEQSPVLLVRN